MFPSSRYWGRDGASWHQKLDLSGARCYMEQAALLTSTWHAVPGVSIPRDSGRERRIGGAVRVSGTSRRPAQAELLFAPPPAHREQGVRGK